MRDRTRTARSVFVVAGISFSLAGCIDQDLVYRDRELFNPPPDAAMGFLGYFDPATKQTSCGNCHGDKQVAWQETKHAAAYETLVASGNVQGVCYGCHTVSERGNVVAEAAGWNAVMDSAYKDVQCESCHGPGFDHMQNPGVNRTPLASILADTNRTDGCGECHRGEHHPFVEQWRASAHATTPYVRTLGSNPACAPCHEGRAAIAITFNESADYVEKTGPDFQPILCATCHDPHGGPYSGQLRASGSVPSKDNLCVKCHSRGGTPVPPQFFGPHSAEGLLVIGKDVGWFPPGFPFDTTKVVGSHGSAANKRLCATCHMETFTAGGFTSVGHSFEAIACLDSQGKPKPGPCAVTERSFKACATSGCHTSDAQARSAFLAVKARLELLADSLWTDRNGNSVMDVTDGGLLPKVVAKAVTKADSNQFNPNDNTLTVAEGAIWNAQLAATRDRPRWFAAVVFGRTFHAKYTGGEGVHNPFLLEALLVSSIQAVKAQYAVSGPPFDPALQTQRPPGVRPASQ